MSAPLDTSTVVLERTEIRDGPVSALVLRCSGEIDSFNAGQLSDAVGIGLAGAGASPAGSSPADGSPADRPPADRLVVVDLRDVTFLGASAITALLVGATGIPAGAGALRLVVGTTRPVLLVIDALDLRSTFSIHPDVPDALRGPRRGTPAPT